MSTTTKDKLISNNNYTTKLYASCNNDQTHHRTHSSIARTPVNTLQSKSCPGMHFTAPSYLCIVPSCSYLLDWMYDMADTIQSVFPRKIGWANEMDYPLKCMASHAYKYCCACLECVSDAMRECFLVLYLQNAKVILGKQLAFCCFNFFVVIIIVAVCYFFVCPSHSHCVSVNSGEMPPNCDRSLQTNQNLNSIDRKSSS